MSDRIFEGQIADILRDYKSPAAAAKAVYKSCRAYAIANGMKPDIEVSIKKPGEPRHHDNTKCWTVTFEAGPYEWAVGASCRGDSNVFAEPYYSFDLNFYGSA